MPIIPYKTKSNFTLESHRANSHLGKIVQRQPSKCKRVSSTLSNIHNPAHLNSSLDNKIYTTDPVPELKHVFDSPAENVDNMNKLIQATPGEALIEEVVYFLDMIARRTGILWETNV